MCCLWSERREKAGSIALNVLKQTLKYSLLACSCVGRKLHAGQQSRKWKTNKTGYCIDIITREI